MAAKQKKKVPARTQKRPQKKKTKNGRTKEKNSALLVDWSSVVCIVSNGSCVPLVGAIGAKEVGPLLRKKASTVQMLGEVTAVPLSVEVKGEEEWLFFCKTISPSCGAIVLDGVVTSECFPVVARAYKELSVPVIDTYQYGIAIAALAGLINAHTVVKKQLKRSRIAILGAGPISIAVARLLLLYGVGDVVVVDRDGILHPLRTNVEGEKADIANTTNKEQRIGGALEAVTGADVVLSISKSGPLKSEYVRMMAQHPIVFILHESQPELTPKELYEVGAAVVAARVEKYPNRITDTLVLPHLLKGILKKGIQRISREQAVSVAEALASAVAKPTAKKILPTVSEKHTQKKILEVLS